VVLVGVVTLGFIESKHLQPKQPFAAKGHFLFFCPKNESMQI
jgi:hypothetical protein